MDSSYPGVDNSCYREVGKELCEGSRSEIVRNSIAWLRENGYMIDPSEGSPQQEPFPNSTHWSDYSQGDGYVTYNSYPTEFPSNYEQQEQNSFEATVMKRFDALQAQLDRMALGNEEISLRHRNNLQTDLLIMGEILTTRFEEEFRAYEAKIIKRLEEQSSKALHMYEKRIHKKCEDLQHEIEAVKCWMVRVERRMENEMGQLYGGMFQAQGRFDVNDSEDENTCGPIPVEELPGYVDESLHEDPSSEGVERRCETIPPMPSVYNENERLLCEDIASSRGSSLTHIAIPEHSIDTKATREWDYMACSPVERRDYSSGAELSSHSEDPLSSPMRTTCYSCEIACTPQIQACFGVLASSTSRINSDEESSWEEKDSMGDIEGYERPSKRKRRLGTQVWIPKGTLEVMRIFHMTELKLGKTSCVPHKAEKRKGRRKFSNPQSGIG